MAFQTKDEASAGGSQEHKLWGGRFRDGLDPLMEEFNASISFDRSVEKKGNMLLQTSPNLVQPKAFTKGFCCCFRMFEDCKYRYIFLHLFLQCMLTTTSQTHVEGRPGRQ